MAAEVPAAPRRLCAHSYGCRLIAPCDPPEKEKMVVFWAALSAGESEGIETEGIPLARSGESARVHGDVVVLSRMSACRA